MRIRHPEPMQLGSAPLFDALTQYDSCRHVSFHMPGHKNGAVIPPLARQRIGHEAFRLDKTAVVGGHVDYPHCPSGVVKQASDLLAQLFGAELSYYSFNGIASGMLLVMCALCRPGDRVLLSSDADLHTMAATALSGCQPVFLPQWREQGMASPLTPPGDLGDCRMVIVRSPTREGRVADLKAWVLYAKEADMILVVDERYGAHLSLSPQFPLGAMAHGAQAALHTNYGLPFPRQTGAVHFHRSLLERWVTKMELDHWHRLLTVTSVSYLMLGILDAARAQLSTSVPEAIDESAGLARELAGRLRATGVQLAEDCLPGEFDPCRILVYVGSCSRQMVADLQRRAGITAESVGEWISLLVGPGTRRRDCDLVVETLPGLLHNSSFSARPPQVLNRRLAVPMAVAGDAPHLTVSLVEAVGRISGELACVSNEEVVLVPGEIVERVHIDRLVGDPIRRRNGIRILRGG